MGKILSVFDVSMINITWDSLHILLTLTIYITLVIFIWVTRIDPCRDHSLRENVNRNKDPDIEIPRCLTWQAWNAYIGMRSSKHAGIPFPWRELSLSHGRLVIQRGDPPETSYHAPALFRESQEVAGSYPGTTALRQLPHTAATPADKVNVRAEYATVQLQLTRWCPSYADQTGSV